MDDIRAWDRKLLVQELLRAKRIVPLFLTWFFVYMLQGGILATLGWPWFLAAFVFPLLVLAFTAYQEAEQKRFRAPRFLAIWNGVKERLRTFDQVIKQLSKEQIFELNEMPKTVRATADTIYCALRRADVITDEVSRTERGLYSNPDTNRSLPNDEQVKELYRIADKNIAEYRSHFAGVMAGVHRAEAQAAVYVTTVDAIRMKLIGHRLAGRRPELSTQEFLESMAEAKLQLQAIDQALEELDFSQWPKTVVVMPPTPEANQQHIGHEDKF